MTPISVAQLVAQGRLEAIAADITAAWNRIDEAKRHLESSATLAASDASLAYVALYDAARKALTATCRPTAIEPPIAPEPTRRSGSTARQPSPP